MKRAALPFVLAGSQQDVLPTVELLSSADAKRAARFWIGKEAYKLRKAECHAAISQAFKDRGRVTEVVAGLRPEERAVLEVVKRYGGTISGALLHRELLMRGVVKERAPTDYAWQRDDPVHRLREHLVLVANPGHYDSYHGRDYPDVSMPRAVADLLSPAPSLDWRASAPPANAPSSTTSRTPTEFMVELTETARALEKLGNWRINQGGELPAAARSRLAKLLPASGDEPLLPPDRVVLNYTMLCALGVVNSDSGDGSIDPVRMERLAHASLEVQASAWVRAWLHLRLWQDGIGGVPDRDGRDESTRIEPRALQLARQSLGWVLTRVAHCPNHWLDLETFLADLHVAVGEKALRVYWHGYAWQPRLAGGAGKNELPPGPARTRAFWFDDGAIWVANALLCTLVHLGLIERGHSGSGRTQRWSFRLTEVGRVVFGAPEVAPPERAGAQSCLTIQPSHEILLYLDAADGAIVTTLGRVATRVSAAGIVQTFKLTRDSVYGALEGGMTPAAIESFLASHSRNGLPDNVAQSLSEWARKRAAIVVRRGVALATVAPGEDVRGRPVGERFVALSPRGASPRAKELHVQVETRPPSKTWRVDEHGTVTVGAPASLVGAARLRRIANQSGTTWRISADSVSAAREHGITAEQILKWLDIHASHGIPVLLSAAIKNWAGTKQRVFLGELVVLRIADTNACQAVRDSTRVHPLIEGTLAPDCLVVRADRRAELQGLLVELGFIIDASGVVAQKGPASVQPPSVKVKRSTDRSPRQPGKELAKA
jgi:hypothetical protein